MADKKDYINRYRQLANLEEDFQITEENINKNNFAFNRTAVEYHLDSNKLRSELLGNEWKGYKLYEN